MAKLAVTPPVVGSVSTEMYGSRARSSRASAAQIFAICISDSAPSIIRAPPEQDTTISGRRSVECALDGARDLLAHDHAHAAADEAVFHRRHDGADALDPAGGDDHGVLEAGRGLARVSRSAYGLRVGELQRVGGGELAIVLLPPLVVEQRAKAIGGRKPEVMRALRADVEVCREVLVVDDLAAVRDT